MTRQTNTPLQRLPLNTSNRQAAVKINAATLDEAIETLERLGCQYNFCDGPTLEPVEMVTCFACETLAKLRVVAGRPPRSDDELTFQERDNERHRAYMAHATGGRYVTLEPARIANGTEG